MILILSRIYVFSIQIKLLKLKKIYFLKNKKLIIKINKKVIIKLMINFCSILKNKFLNKQNSPKKYINKIIILNKKIKNNKFQKKLSISKKYIFFKKESSIIDKNSKIIILLLKNKNRFNIKK